MRYQGITKINAQAMILVQSTKDWFFSSKQRNASRDRLKEREETSREALVELGHDVIFNGRE